MIHIATYNYAAYLLFISSPALVTGGTTHLNGQASQANDNREKHNYVHTLNYAHLHLSHE